MPPGGPRPPLGAPPQVVPGSLAGLTPGCRSQDSRCGWTQRAALQPGRPWSAGLCGEPGSGPAVPLCPQAAKLHEQEHKEESLRLQQLEERRRLQEAELRRVEEEKERALGLQRRERELRARLLSLLLSKKADEPRAAAAEPGPASPADLLRPVLDILHTVSASAGAAPRDREPAVRPAAPQNLNGSVAAAAAPAAAAAQEEAAPGKEGQDPRGPEDSHSEKRCPAVLACIPDNTQQPKAAPAACEPSAPRKDARSEQDKCNREPSGGGGRTGGGAGRDDGGDAEHRPKRERSAPRRRAGSREDGRPRRERRAHRKRSRQGRSASPEERGRPRKSRSRSRERRSRREKSQSRGRERDRRASSSRKRSRHRRGDDRPRSGSAGRHRSAWNR